MAGDHMLDQLYGVLEERSVMLKPMLSVMAVVLRFIPMVDAHTLDQPFGVSEEKSVMLMQTLMVVMDSAMIIFQATLTFPDPESVTGQVVSHEEHVVSAQQDGDGVTITMLCQVTPISNDLEYISQEVFTTLI